MNLKEQMNEVKSVGEKIKAEGVKYDQQMEKMYQAIGTLGQHWTGNQADYLVFMSRVAKQEKNMRMVGKIFQEYGQLLEDISSNTTTVCDSIDTTVGRV